MSFKEIIRYLSSYKKDVYLTMAMSLFVAGLYVVIPAIYGKLVDLVLQENLVLHENTGKQLFVLLGFWLVINLVINTINHYRSQRQYNIAVKCERDLIIDSNAHLIKLPLSFHKEKRIGEMFEKISRAGSNLNDIIGQVIFSTLPRLFTAIIILIVLFDLSYKLGFVIILIIAIYSFVTLLKIKPLTKTEGELSKALENIHGDIYDSVINAKTIKSFTAERTEAEKHQNSYQEVVTEYSSLLNIWSKLQMVQSNILEIGFILIFSISLLLLEQEEITAGQLVMVIGYLTLIYKPISSLSENYISIKRGMVSIDRVELLLKMQTESYDGILLSELSRGEIEFRNVSFSYNGDDATLKDINFVAENNQTIALVGESGSGKSTLFDLVPRFIKPRKGSIYLDGIDISKINLHSLRKKIAIVPQDIILFNDTIANNIRFGKPDATDEEIIASATLANADEFIQSFPNKYEQLVGERGIILSAGQRQRIAFARAIIKNPKILILDEATSSLDSKSEKLIQEALEKLTKGKTTFVIAHRLSTIRNADKILVLKDGRIIEQGTHQELLRKNRVYKELYDLQNF